MCFKSCLTNVAPEVVGASRVYGALAFVVVLRGSGFASRAPSAWEVENAAQAPALASIGVRRVL